jgi:hypothetical protein
MPPLVAGRIDRQVRAARLRNQQLRGEESDSPPPRYQYRDRREKINEVTVNVPLIPAPRIFKAPANTVTIGIAAL